MRLALLFLLLTSSLAARQIAYIYGDVASDGTTPSGGAPFHQMLLSDTGNRGCSMFKALVEAEGYTITQHYDADTTLDATFLDSYDVVIFGLHQKIWSSAEKTALDAWIRTGGGILMYSDSASGGHHGTVGIKNPVGQMAVNNVLTPYGMQVTVDQGGGTRSYTSNTNQTNPVVWDQPAFEGEGVSPVAVDPASDVEVLIPLDDTHKVSGGGLNIDTRNITITNPLWAALALKRHEQGHIMAIFDRQPMWNNGEGSSIQQRDNHEILRRIVKYLARDYANAPEWFDLQSTVKEHPVDGGNYLELSYRQWKDGLGITGVDYQAHKVLFGIEYTTDLTNTWQRGTNFTEQVGAAVNLGDGSERVTVRLLPTALRGYARFRVADAPAPMIPITVDAGDESIVGESGSLSLNGSVSGSANPSVLWSQESGPGTTTFTDATAATSSATFDMPGTYTLRLTADNGGDPSSDTVLIRVIASADVVRAINCGGNAYVGNNGFTYEADALFTGGHIDNFPGNPVANTEDDTLYNTARSAHSAYTIPVVNGNYRVYLQMAETFFTAPNQRVFNATIETIPVLADLDLFVEAPGKWVIYDRSFSTTVSDGQLDLGFSASVNNPLLNGLVIIRE